MAMLATTIFSQYDQMCLKESLIVVPKTVPHWYIEIIEKEVAAEADP